MATAAMMALLPLGVAAQSAGPAETARGVTVLTRPRPDFDPLGVRLPGFRLDASLDLGAGYDDNTAGTGADEKSAGFFENQINVALNSTYSRHALGLDVTQAMRQYVGEEDYRWTDYGIRAFGRYDIGRASSVGAAYNRSRNHIDVTSFEVQQGTLTRPLRYDVESFRANGVAALNRVNLTGALERRSYRFQEQVDPGLRGGSANANDYTVLMGEVGAEYVVVPGRSVTLTTRLSEVSYDQARQRGRDSSTWEVLVGGRYDVTALAYASFGIGYRQRDYSDPNIPSVSGPAFEGALILLPSQLLTVTLGVQRSIEESIRSSNVNYVLTSGRVRADFEFRRNIILSGELRAERLEYQSPDATASQGAATLSAQFLLNRNASITASYRHTRSLSTPGGFQEFDRNVFLIQLRMAI